MTAILAARQHAAARLAPVSDTAALDAQLLLAHVLDMDRALILAYPERALTADQARRYDDLVSRAADGEPIAYLLGRRAWYDLDLIVTPAVLIPRWETEHLLELSIESVRRGDPLSRPLLGRPPRAVDVGTGSGALAIGLAKHAPPVDVHAVDVSAAALEIARANAAQHGVAVTFHQGDLLAPFLPSGDAAADARGAFDLIVANLPYIPSEIAAGLAVARYEPWLALDGGADGLALVRRLLDQIVGGRLLRAGGCILLEIGADQGADALSLAQTHFPTGRTALIQDLAGRDRIVRIDLSPHPPTPSPCVWRGGDRAY
jgi:release factor glutamine methyltransferase